jgi:glycosyltransferase involved in cell wall biosynthesis
MKNSRFTGVLKGEALAREYAGFDLFVFPSRTDTFGNVVLEALASGVPTIVTNAGGPQYLIREGQTGYVCRDIRELVAASRRLITDSTQRNAMSRAAREYAITHHDWDAVFAQVYSDYEAYLSGQLVGVGRFSQQADRDGPTHSIDAMQRVRPRMETSPVGIQEGLGSR